MRSGGHKLFGPGAFMRKVLVSLLLLPVSKNEVKADDDERDAEPLPHVERHLIFERHLVFFHKFDEEAEGEDCRQTESEEEAAMQLLAVAPVQVNHHEEKRKIGQRFV